MHTTDSFPDQEIEELKSLSEQFPAFFVRLEARTDSVGSPRYNLALANRRLNFIRNELIKRGIKEDCLVEFVFGEDEPLADNQSPEGRQANRSVRVVAGQYAPIRMISGRFVSDEDGRGLDGILYTGTRYKRDTIVVDSTGYFTFPVHEGAIFFMEFFSRDHIMGRTYFNLSRINPVLGSIPLQILQEGNTFSFGDILFVGNQSVVLPESRPSLPRLLQMIERAANYRFEIQGHVNIAFFAHPKTKNDSISNRLANPSNDDFIENEIDSSRLEYRGYSLSDARAKTIFNYLVENGIDSNRLEWKGYRSKNMLFPNATTETQARQNRRVSVKVLGRIDE